MDSTRRTARLAGFLYLLLMITNLFGLLDAPLVSGDATAIAKQISVPRLRFRLHIVSDLLANVIGALLVLVLFQLLKSIDKKCAALMVVLVLVTVPISFMITLNDVAAHALLSGEHLFSTFSKDQLNALAMVFLGLHVHGVFAVEVFWGLWLFPFGYLVFKSRFLPSVLGVLLIVAGVAYVAHSFVSLLMPEHRSALYEYSTMVARAGEIPMMLWLLIKGARFDVPPDKPALLAT